MSIDATRSEGNTDKPIGYLEGNTDGLKRGIEINALTIEEIGEKLKNMIVGEGKYLPMIFVSFLVKNPNYDPTNFSQEIENSEEEVDVLNEMLIEMKNPEFDIIWNNTLHNVKTNSRRWCENHSKKYQIILLANWMLLQSKTHEKGVRNFYSEENINKIKTVIEEYGEIYDFR